MAEFYGYLVLLHVLGATVWTGGHIVLAMVVLPRVLAARSPEMLLAFESGFEKVGIPALAVQVITGLALAWMRLPHPAQWLDPSDPGGRLIGLKLLLLALTAAFAAHARLQLIPGLTAARLNLLAMHIWAVTVTAVLFVITGVSFRAPGLF